MRVATKHCCRYTICFSVLATMIHLRSYSEPSRFHLACALICLGGFLAFQMEIPQLARCWRSDCVCYGDDMRPMSEQVRFSFSADVFVR